MLRKRGTAHVAEVILHGTAIAVVASDHFSTRDIGGAYAARPHY